MIDERRSVSDYQQQQQDIKRILIERDITILKQTFCRIMCAEMRNNSTRIFVPHRLFLQDRLQSYLFNKELSGFGRQVLESEDFNVRTSSCITCSANGIMKCTPSPKTRFSTAPT